MFRKNFTLFCLSAAILCCSFNSWYFVSSMPIFNEITAPARARLFLTLLEEYTDFMIETLKYNRNLLQAVLNDPTIKGNDDVRLQVRTVANTVTRIDGLPRDRSLYLAAYPQVSSVDFASLMDFIKRYNIAARGYVSPRDELFKKALEKNGVHTNDMMNYLLNRFKDVTSPNLIKVIGDYVNSLPNSEKRNQYDVVQLYENMKSENNAQRKYDLFTLFFSIEKENIHKMRQQMH